MVDPENIQVTLTRAEARALVGLVRKLKEAGWHAEDDGKAEQSRSLDPIPIEVASFSTSEIRAAQEIELFETEAEASRRAKLLKLAAGIEIGRTVGKTLDDHETYQRVDKGNKERSVTTTQIR